MALSLFLKIIAPVFILVGALHIVLGPGAELLLGATVSPEFIRDPVMDSQNRFYGIAFSLYGFLMFVCAGDLIKYRTVLLLVIWVFFAAGLARLVSIAIVGLPSAMVLGLLASELILPPLLHLWLRFELRLQQAVQAHPNSDTGHNS